MINQGIGLIDATIIYATMKNGFQIWTLDKKFIKYLSQEYLYQG